MSFVPLEMSALISRETTHGLGRDTALCACAPALPAWGSQKAGGGQETRFSQELQLCQARRHGSAKSYSSAKLPGPTITDWPFTEGSGNSLQWMHFGKLSISVTIFSYIWTTTFCFLWKLLMKQTLVFWEIPLASLRISKWVNHLAEKNRFRHGLACHYRLLYHITFHNCVSSGKRQKSVVCGKLDN